MLYDTNMLISGSVGVEDNFGKEYVIHFSFDVIAIPFQGPYLTRLPILVILKYSFRVIASNAIPSIFFLNAFLI